MECSRNTKNKMFKRKNQTEENKWLLETPFCKLQILLKVNILRLKFILLFFCFFCSFDLDNSQSKFVTLGFGTVGTLFYVITGK